MPQLGGYRANHPIEVGQRGTSTKRIGPDLPDHFNQPLTTTYPDLKLGRHKARHCDLQKRMFSYWGYLN